jgi:hypothetical protein
MGRVMMCQRLRYWYRLSAFLVSVFYFLGAGTHQHATAQPLLELSRDLTADNDVFLALLDDGSMGLTWDQSTTTAGRRDIRFARLDLSGQRIQVRVVPTLVGASFGSTAAPTLLAPDPGRILILFGGTTRTRSDTFLKAAESRDGGGTWAILDGAFSAGSGIGSGFRTQIVTERAGDGTIVNGYGGATSTPSVPGFGFQIGLNNSSENLRTDPRFFGFNFLNTAVEGASGSVFAVSDGVSVNSGPDLSGLQVFSVYPTFSTSFLAIPGSEAGGHSWRPALTGRPGLPGLFTAFATKSSEFSAPDELVLGAVDAAGVGSGERVSLNEIARGRSLHDFGVAPGADGRLWVVWYDRLVDAEVLNIGLTDTSTSRLVNTRRFAIRAGSSFDEVSSAAVRSDGQGGVVAAFVTKSGVLRVARAGGVSARITLRCTRKRSSRSVRCVATESGFPLHGAVVRPLSVAGGRRRTTKEDGSAIFELASNARFPVRFTAQADGVRPGQSVVR